MIELRCQRRMHAQLDPVNLRLVVKCHQCTNRERRDIFHTWSLTEIIREIEKGNVAGVLSPESPQWVHWQVR